jgi:hypothetical protein
VFMHLQPTIRRRALAAAAVTGFAAMAVAVVPSHATGLDVRELLKSTGHEHTHFAPLVAGTTYRASLVTPTPRLTPQVPGWTGAQFVTLQHGQARYQWAALVWQHENGGDIAIIGGPAMTLSPAAAIAAPRKRARYWRFGPGEAPGPVKHWLIAGHQALYFDATNPGPSGWTLLGSSPPEDQAHAGQSFRMSAMAVHGKTVVIIIQTPKGEALGQFLSVAAGLLSTLEFAAA